MKRNVLVIGASGDIGKSIVAALAHEEFQFILHYNQNRGGIEELLNKLDPLQVLSVIQADLSKEKNVEQFLKKLVFPVDTVVFASGRAYYGLLQTMSEEMMKEMLHLHVYAPWLITKHVLPSMIQNKKGHIIFVTSIWGEQGASFETIYSSVKGAQNTFVKALAKEVGPSGILVNGVSPGYIETKMNNHLKAQEKLSLYEEIPLHRPGKPEEVANVIRFLLDERSSYIQGEIINITGGW